MPSSSQDGKNRCVTRMETTSVQTPSVRSVPGLFSKLFVKAASINKESADSSAVLFVAHFFGEK